jgi:uncharacterized protein (DUF305 family)
VPTLSAVPNKILLAVTAVLVTACQSRRGDTEAAGGGQESVAASADTTGAGGAAAKGDSGFLALMSDHHQGLIVMAQDAEKRGPASVRRDAARLATEQQREQQQMLQHLSAEYGAPHQPEVMPKNQAMADSLEQLSGEAYARTFYHHVMAHHQEGIGMMDSAAASLADAKVQDMVSRMRQQQSREMEEFEGKMRHHMGGEGHE